jgi:uncharacterized membrane protein HdeD (DUF308 family)
MQQQGFKKLAPPNGNWLKTYYFLRAGVSVTWIALALAIGRSSLSVAAILLVLYPTWDAVANAIDAKKNGGFRSNLSQTFNFAISLVTAVWIAYSLGIGMKPVLVAYGAWAFLAGVFQLATGVRRWKTVGGQWVMILSGAQSALVSFHFFQKSDVVPAPGIDAVIPYACLGAFYFLLSAIWLTVKDARQRAANRAFIP